MLPPFMWRGRGMLDFTSWELYQSSALYISYHVVLDFLMMSFVSQRAQVCLQFTDPHGFFHQFSHIQCSLTLILQVVLWVSPRVMMILSGMWFNCAMHCKSGIPKVKGYSSIVGRTSNSTDIFDCWNGPRIVLTILSNHENRSWDAKLWEVKVKNLSHTSSSHRLSSRKLTSFLAPFLQFLSPLVFKFFFNNLFSLRQKAKKPTHHHFGWCRPNFWTKISTYGDECQNLSKFYVYKSLFTVVPSPFFFASLATAVLQHWTNMHCKYRSSWHDT